MVTAAVILLVVSGLAWNAWRVWRTLGRLGTPVARSNVIWTTRTAINLESAVAADYVLSPLICWIGFTRHGCVISVCGVRRAIQVLEVRSAGRSGSKLRLHLPGAWCEIKPSDLEGVTYMFEQMSLIQSRT